MIKGRIETTHRCALRIHFGARLPVFNPLKQRYECPIPFASFGRESALADCIRENMRV
jgi:hypothetical protein